MSARRRRIHEQRGGWWPAMAVTLLIALAWPATAAAQQAAGTPSQKQDRPDAREVLSRAEEVYDALTSLQAEFDQTIEVTLLGRSHTGTGTWYQKGRGRFKMAFTEPEDDVIVADGSHLWLYYPSTHPNQVIRSAIEADVTGSGMVDLQGRIFDEAGAGYAAEFEGREVVDEHATLRVLMTPTGDSPYRHVRVWVDAESFLVRKFEILERNETLRTVVLRDLQPNARIPDAVFRFEPPAGTDVFQG